jgi:SAM-dependent methyltransferase
MVLDPPSPFVAEWLPRIAAELPGSARALDVAMGRGRHVQLLASAGLMVFGVDVNVELTRETVNNARERGVNVRAWCADLTSYPLPSLAFDLILVTRYLQRDLLPALGNALRPRGMIVYETFTQAQRRHGRGPTSPNHLLRAGELIASFPDFEVVFSEEVLEPDAVARLVARKKTLR